MRWLRWVVILLAFFEAGWMTFDGTRALIVGDYLTPSGGAQAGQLGPWTKAVRAVGIEPRSTLMKTLFIIYGVGWIIILLCYILNFPWARWAMLFAAAGALWYLWTGTVFSTAQIALLLILAAQKIQLESS